MASAAAGDSSKREYQRKSEKSLVVIFVKVRTGYSAALAWMDPGARYVVLLARSYQQPRRRKEERLCVSKPGIACVMLPFNYSVLIW